MVPSTISLPLATRMGAVELTVGDTISIPANLAHQARNVGVGDAVLMIVFTSAHREVQGE